LQLEFVKDEDNLDITRGRGECVANFDKLYMLRDISLRYFNGETISNFSSRHCNLRYLNLDCCQSLHSCPSVGDLFALEELTFEFCSKLAELPNLQQLMRLRKLNIENCQSIVAVPGLGNLVALVEFKASSCSSLVALPDMHKLTNLQTLSLNFCYSLKGMPNLLNLARLQSVQILYCSFKDVLCLGNLIFLRSISISWCINLETLPDMHKLTRLEELNVDQCKNIVDWAWVSISKSSDTLWVDQPTTGTGMGLRTLSLWDVGCRELPDLSWFPELKKLEITRCGRLERLINTMPMTALEWLDLDYCPELQEVPDLSQCRLLTYCKFRGCKKISLTTDKITKLKAMCPGLRVVFCP
jgi:hypothetical protein